MIIATTIILIVLVPVMWLIFVPLEIKVDTNHSLYEISQFGTIKLSFHPGQLHFMRLRVLGLPINLSANDHSEVKEPEPERKKPKQLIKKSSGSWLFLIKGLARAIRCRRFIVNADVVDVVLGAQLFSLVSFRNTESFQININFQRRYYLNVWIQIRVHQICWTVIRFFLTKK